ncbi:hypothetical protein [Streptomyces sp. NPDC093223]|uniref:hypothetical protein n=1 Tax=Streptomyces sp. NPDC093223 TaxID=3366033 RepID=UPI003805C2A3
MTIAVDFDGVIHAYSRGWADGSIYDDPMPGALDGLRTLMDQDAIFIFTTREPEHVAAWLSTRGFICRTDHDGPFWNQRGQLLVTNRKLAATAYLDDRAVKFIDWDRALADLASGTGTHVEIHVRPDPQHVAEAIRDVRRFGTPPRRT